MWVRCEGVCCRVLVNMIVFVHRVGCSTPSLVVFHGLGIKTIKINTLHSLGGRIKRPTPAVLGFNL